MLVDPSESGILTDRAVSGEAVRLYYLLASGKTLGEAAAILGRNEKVLARYERQLRRAKYLEMHLVYGDGSTPQRVYHFLKRGAPAQIAS